MLKLKAFIYRFSNIFGLRIYLAGKEEDAFIATQNLKSGISEGIARGSWQAKHGFTTIWTWGQPLHLQFWKKLKHAFGR
jgi:hypothetical protein